MSIIVSMPEMGESVVEGTVEKWLVQEGDAVDKDQVICEVTTDKVDAEIVAPEAGMISQILVTAGTTVKVGVELASIDPGAAGKRRPAAKSAREGEAPAENGSRASRSGTSGSGSPGVSVSAAGSVGSGATGGSAAAGAVETRATPLARRIAEDRGLPLASVAGTGAGGRVTKSDVLAHGGTSAAAPGAAVPAAEPGTLGEFLSRMRVPEYPVREGDEVIPFSAIRRRIAEHMVVSKVVSPHVGTVAELDLHRLVALRDASKAAFKRQHGFSLTYLPFIVYATVRALREFPSMNATVNGETIVQRAGIHVGVAVETPKGLLVPVIKDAGDYSVTGLARAIDDLATRARDRKITADELNGGTFTVTNPGRQGNLYGFAVINQPQVGILRVGEIKKRPVVVERDGEDGIAIRPMMYLALSYDHRIIDGVTGNGFLYTVAKHLEAAEFEI